MKKLLIIMILFVSTTILVSAQNVVVTKGGDKYHKENCQYVKGKKDLTKMTLAEAKKKGLAACSVCFADDKNKNKDADKNKTKTKTK
jgi:hypothetical protein